MNTLTPVLVMLALSSCGAAPSVSRISTIPPDALRIRTQLAAFEQLLEVTSSETYTKCTTLGAYNNIEARGELNLPVWRQGLPESKSSYVDGCRGAQFLLSTRTTNLVAEAELVPVRKKLTEYFAHLDSVADYALAGGYDGNTLDFMDKNSSALLTEAREAILAAKRTYR